MRVVSLFSQLSSGGAVNHVTDSAAGQVRAEVIRWSWAQSGMKGLQRILASFAGARSNH